MPESRDVGQFSIEGGLLNFCGISDENLTWRTGEQFVQPADLQLKLAHCSLLGFQQPSDRIGQPITDRHDVVMAQELFR